MCVFGEYTVYMVHLAVILIWAVWRFFQTQVTANIILRGHCRSILWQSLANPPKLKVRQSVFVVKLPNSLFTEFTTPTVK